LKAKSVRRKDRKKEGREERKAQKEKTTTQTLIFSSGTLINHKFLVVSECNFSDIIKCVNLFLLASPHP
jgi:hypothetical protein